MSVNNVSDELLNAMNTRDVKAASKSTVQETEDRFLKLLVAQMQNQDPLNPMDNSQVTSQMAQLSTVTGINKLNDTLDTLMASLSSNQTLEAASMIGHGVLINGDSIQLQKAADYVDETTGETVPGASIGIMGVDLQSAASNVVVKIYNANGALMKTMSMGSSDAGVIPISWDGSTDTGGTAPAGRYSFSVEAKMNGQSVTANPLSFGEVMSVTKGTDNSVKLNASSLGAISLNDIRQIL